MRRRKDRRASQQRSAADSQSALDIALRYYGQHGCIAFWNPRDITDENLRTDTPDVEALVIEPGNVMSCEVQEGQYVVERGVLQAYDSYPGHKGVDKIFNALKHTRVRHYSITAIAECVKMGWVIMEASEGEDGIYFKRYEPSE